MRQNELFPIGEVSRMFHVSVSILRHYDKIGLVKPEYVDPQTGYRFYSARQFECLNTIRYLRALDMPLDEIARFLQNRNTDGIRGMLLRQKAEVERREEEIRVIRRKIENRLDQIEDALRSQLDIVTVSSSPARRLACLKRSLMPRSYLDLEYSIRELEQTEKNAVTFLGKVGVGLSEQALRAHRFTPYELVFIVLDEEDSFSGSTLHLPQETCVSIRFRGGHERAPAYYERLMRYVEERHAGVAGFSREITMIDEGLTCDHREFVTEIQIPVTGI